MTQQILAGIGGAAAPVGLAYGDTFVTETPSEQVLGRTARGFESFSGGWTWTEFGPSATTFTLNDTSNTINRSAFGTWNAVGSPSLGSVDQFVEIDWFRFSDGSLMGVCLRTSDIAGDLNAYVVDFPFTTGAIRPRINKILAGVETELLQTTLAVPTGSTVRVEVQGTLISVTADSSTESTNDSDISTGESCGVAGRASRTEMFQNFGCGSL